MYKARPKKCPVTNLKVNYKLYTNNTHSNNECNLLTVPTNLVVERERFLQYSIEDISQNLISIDLEECDQWSNLISQYFSLGKRGYMSNHKREV